MIGSLNERLKKCRKDARLSQIELADKIAVHPNTLRKWENGERSPNTAKLEAIAQVTGVSIAWLLGLDNLTRGTITETPDKIRYDTNMGMHDAVESAEIGNFNTFSDKNSDKNIAKDFDNLRNDIKNIENNIKINEVSPYGAAIVALADAGFPNIFAPGLVRDMGRRDFIDAVAFAAGKFADRFLG